MKTDWVEGRICASEDRVQKKKKLTVADHSERKKKRKKRKKNPTANELATVCQFFCIFDQLHYRLILACPFAVVNM